MVACHGGARQHTILLDTHLYSYPYMSGQEPPAIKPLTGVRVLDLSRMIAGGVAGMQLADFGADVVKVEAAAAAAIRCASGPPTGEPFWWQVYARNKRFITLNLKIAGGRELLLEQLLPRFDVVMESFVPGHARAAGSRLGRAARAGTRS